MNDSSMAVNMSQEQYTSIVAASHSVFFSKSAYSSTGKTRNLCILYRISDLASSFDSIDLKFFRLFQRKYDIRQFHIIMSVIKKMIPQISDTNSLESFLFST